MKRNHPVRAPKGRPVLLLLLCLSGGPAAGAVGDPGLENRLGEILRDNCLRNARVGIRVSSLEDGSTLYDRNGSGSLVPASNVKIFTAAAALKVFGPDYRFPTTFHADRPPVDGVVEGPLYLKGWGAPDLVGEAWWLMARELGRLGLRSVEGGLILDDSRFDAVRRPAGWPRAVVDRAYNAPVSALSSNYNVVTIRVVAAGGVGERPEIQLIPFQAHLQVVNQARIRRAPRKVSVFRTGGPGSRKILVKGSLPPGGEPVEAIRSIEDPTMYAGYSFREVARTEGIRIAGAIRRGTVPEDAVELYRHHSKPLSAILRDMNKFSNNFIAEIMLKALSADAGHRPGTTEGGRRVVGEVLEGMGVDLRGVEIRDGSGLAEGNRATAVSLVSTLRVFGRDFGVFPELLASLPIAGIDGTLEDRDGEGTGGGRVRAKTGRLEGVDTLSGYAAGAGGTTRVFSFLVNGSQCPHERVTAVLDRMAGRIAVEPEGARPEAGSAAGLKSPASPPAP